MKTANGNNSSKKKSIVPVDVLDVVEQSLDGVSVEVELLVDGEGLLEELVGNVVGVVVVKAVDVLHDVHDASEICQS